MADKAVSELIEAERITATDLFVLEQNGTAKKLTGQVLLNWLTAAADGHGGIQSIQKVSTSGLADTYRITLADTTTFDFVVTNGRGVTSIQKKSTNGLVDTYIINFNDNTSATFTVTNGEKGDKGDNQYVWIKYASQEPTASSHSFGDVADNWMGIYSGDSATAPTDWQQYTWFEIKGAKGDQGEAATLTSSQVEYQASDSGSIIPSGVWSESVPVVTQGRYLWTRTTNTFNTGSPVVAYSVSRMGLDGTGSVSSVANISPDTNGNVPLTAEHIGAVPSAGGEMTGELKMNGQPISGLNAPTANDHAANMGFVNQQVKKAAPRNLLDNSDFRNPVNQRGLTEYSGTSNSIYTIDRWRTVLAGTVHRLVSNGLKVSGTTAGRHSIQTSLENPTQHVGKTVTLAAFIAENNADSDLQLTIWYGKGSSYQSSSSSGISMSIPVGTTGLVCVSGVMAEMGEYTHANPCIRITNGTGSIVVSWMALYEGEYTSETLPEYQPKGYGAELAECQRYYQRISASNRAVGYGYTTSATLLRGFIPLTAEMRVAPSIDAAELTFRCRTDGGNYDLTYTQGDSLENLGNALCISLTGENLPVSHACIITVVGNFGLSADL